MQAFIDWLKALADQVPVTWFVAIGAMVEEVLAPIPSPFVMMLGGSIAASQENTMWFLLWLAFVGALSKTLGSFIIYVIADKAEDVMIDKFGKFLGISSEETEGLGKFLNGGKKQAWVIFLMRALPIMPTAPVSVIAGVIKIDLKQYLFGTFTGLILRNLIYLYIGYTSIGALESFSEGFDSLEKIGYFILSIIAGIALLWMYRKRQQGSALTIVEKLINSLKNYFK